MYPILQFFRTEPLACSPSDLPKCPPSKEYDARLRQEEARRYDFISFLSVHREDAVEMLC